MSLAEKEVLGIVEDNGAEAVETVALSIKKTYPVELVEAIAAANVGITIIETENSYRLSGEYISVVRGEIEKAIGALPDAKWRVLFMNRDGQVNEFDNNLFTIGTPKPTPAAVEAAEQKETVQLNVRVDKVLKSDMEFLRALLPNVNQNAFVEEALREYVGSLKKELI